MEKTIILRFSGGMRPEPLVWSRIDNIFWEGMRLCKPEPMVLTQGKSHVSAFEMLDGWVNIEDCEFFDPVWKI